MCKFRVSSHLSSGGKVFLYVLLQGLQNLADPRATECHTVEGNVEDASIRFGHEKARLGKLLRFVIRETLRDKETQLLIESSVSP